MSDFFESGSFVLPSELRKDVADRLKTSTAIKSVELQINGENLQKAEAFASLLQSLKRQGVKITHEFSIKLDFPKGLSRQKALEIVELMPKPVNGSVKVKMEIV